jgi:hypothetical protein
MAAIKSISSTIPISITVGITYLCQVFLLFLSLINSYESIQLLDIAKPYAAQEILTAYLLLTIILDS